MSPTKDQLKIMHSGKEIETESIMRVAGKEIAIGKPFETTSRAGDGKTPRQVIRFFFKHQDAKKPNRIDVWRSKENPNIGEIGFHQFKGEYAHPQTPINMIKLIEKKLADMGFKEVKITKGIARSLAFFMHLGYTHQDKHEQEKFENSLRAQWPKEAPDFKRPTISRIFPTFFPDRPQRRLGSALARLSVHQRKCPKTTIRKRLR